MLSERASTGGRRLQNLEAPLTVSQDNLRWGIVLQNGKIWVRYSVRAGPCLIRIDPGTLPDELQDHEAAALLSQATAARPT